MLALQTDFFGETKLLLAQDPGLVKQVERQVRLNQIQARSDGQGDVA